MKTPLPAGPQEAIVDVGLAVLLRERPATTAGSHSVREALITLRPRETVYGGWWEIPGGKLEPEESLDDCIVRELEEEVGARARVLGPLPGVPEIVHRYPHATVRLHARVCELLPDSPPPSNRTVADHRWADADLVEQTDFPPANDEVKAALVRLLRQK
ncbi:MAG: NUDIX domain-containing protein [Planctomycetota bacterium]|nr:NUDIX domain-containing protein [Planctomycetota bacterium]